MTVKMMGNIIRLNRSELALLLRVINTPDGKIAGDILNDAFSNEGRVLMEAGMINPCFSPDIDVALDFDGRFHEPEWCSDTRAFWYFTAGAGWVSVASDNLKTYRLETDVMLGWFSRFLDISDRYPVTPVVPEVLWHLGETRVGNVKLNIYFVRHIQNMKNMSVFLSAMGQESHRAPSLIISSGKVNPLLVQLPLDVAIADVQDLILREGQYVKPDQGVIKTIISGKGRISSSEYTQSGGIGLRFSTDYRIVFWNGKEYRLTKKQAAVVEALVREGGQVHKDLLRAEANTNEDLYRIMRNKVNGVWVSHPLWKTLIRSCGDGYYEIVGD